MKRAILLSTLAAVTACQTTTTGPGSINLQSATINSGDTVTGTVPTSTNDGDFVVVGLEAGITTVLVRQTSMDHGRFRGALVSASGTGGIYTRRVAYSGESSTGDMAASVASFPNRQGAVIARLGNTAMPVSGSANYSGQYVGILNGGPVFFGRSHVKGDVAMTADFSAATVSGNITNRQSYNYNPTPFNTLQDVTLNATAIDGTGAFSGTLTGGAVNGFGSSIDTSSGYSGLIGGATGNQVAGSMNLTRTYGGFSGNQIIEIGVFLGE